MRDDHCVLHLTVLPGADTSYRNKNEGQSPCPPPDCPTSTDQNFFCFVGKIQKLDFNIKLRCIVYVLTVPTTIEKKGDNNNNYSICMALNLHKSNQKKYDC